MKLGRIKHIIAVLLAAVFMTWPAIYNGYPLLYPDSMSYLQDGGRVARAVFLHQLSEDYGGRSFIYCMGILPFHWNVTAWPVVGLQAILTAYVLWLTVRSVLPRWLLFSYFVLVIPLCMLTSLGWFVGYIMPDILGAVLYLCIFLMVYCWNDLSRAERFSIVLIAWWSAASHPTHLILAIGLCFVLTLLLILQRQPLRRWLWAVGRIAVIVVVAALSHMALHAYLYGEPSINGKHPSFVMARVIADGPGRWYLQQHREENLAICRHLDRLPDNVADFLWAQDGIWQTSSPAEQDRMRAEEMHVVLGTIRAYPQEELRISTANAWRQLETCGLWNYGPAPWILEMFDTVLPRDRDRYLQSRQANEELHIEFFTTVSDWTVLVSLGVIAVWSLLLWRGWSSRLVGLTVIISFVVIFNAVVTGILSNVEDRYQSRVVWLVPMLAGVLVLAWLARRACHADSHACGEGLSCRSAE